MSDSYRTLNPRAPSFVSIQLSLNTHVSQGYPRDDEWPSTESSPQSPGLNPAAPEFRPSKATPIKVHPGHVPKSKDDVSCQPALCPSSGRFGRRSHTPKPLPSSFVFDRYHKKDTVVGSDMIELQRQGYAACCFWGDQKKEVHHFTWTGQPVAYKNQTPAALSLAIIMSLSRVPKGLTHGSQKYIHKSVVMKQALSQIDPVVFIGEQGSLSDKTGTKLQEYATGQTFKLYSREGAWHDDVYDEDEEKPYIDFLEAREYYRSDTVLNGWHSNNGAPLREDFIEKDFAHNTVLATSRQLNLIRRVSVPAKASSLSQLMTREDLACGDILDVTVPARPVCVPKSNWAGEAEEMEDLPLNDDYDWKAVLGRIGQVCASDTSDSDLATTVTASDDNSCSSSRSRASYITSETTSISSPASTSSSFKVDESTSSPAPPMPHRPPPPPRRRRVILYLKMKFLLRRTVYSPPEKKSLFGKIKAKLILKRDSE